MDAQYAARTQNSSKPSLMYWIVKVRVLKLLGHKTPNGLAPLIFFILHFSLLTHSLSCILVVLILLNTVGIFFDVVPLLYLLTMFKLLETQKLRKRTSFNYKKIKC